MARQSGWPWRSPPLGLHRGRFAAPQHDVEAVAERPFGLSDGHVELANEAAARRIIWDRQKDRIEFEQRVARKIHLRDQPCGEAGAEKREMNVVGPPGIV